MLVATGAPLLVLLTAGMGRLWLTLTGTIDTFDANGVSDSRPNAGLMGDSVLVIGSDGRVNGNSALGGGNQHDVGRSDTAFLLHVYGDHQHAVTVSIPRDTLVTIPPCRLPDGCRFPVTERWRDHLRWWDHRGGLQRHQTEWTGLPGGRTPTRHGFTVARTGNQNHAATFVQYDATLKSQAQKVSQLFPGAQLRQVTGPGINVVLGQSYAASAMSVSRAPASLAANARSADDDLCSNLSYG
ncbi:LCP family protein [Streptomyces sp. RLA2-12]|nr:LCP family protein [Streptomyces sp. RLA2-12]QDN62016.1 LytR family transcriptional regulator [Streptomyces sp. S1D4-20]QDN72068.1 LytR family transcriptional regulator [Streptomyces sp. S1D4-14]QDO54525.1 LytR family transcriptional regulator [Streptomyces sp. RLB3-5]QDO64770.1 LytR family transcriptional regulator [Streptomyces sp. RLB1-8]